MVVALLAYPNYGTVIGSAQGIVHVSQLVCQLEQVLLQ